jgi:hypothetical protein
LIHPIALGTSVWVPGSVIVGARSEAVVCPLTLRVRLSCPCASGFHRKMIWLDPTHPEPYQLHWTTPTD